VEIRTVRKSEAGRSPDGQLPTVVQVRDPVRVGGRYDTVTGTFTGPCDSYRVWYVGEKQYEILFSPESQHSLIYSAEGAGKTVTMAMWIWLQIFAAAAAGTPGSIGATAPTAKRLGTLQRAVTDLAPISSSRDPISEGAWGTLFVDAGEIQTCSGHLIQFRSTKRQSGSIGSPVQGYTWHLGAAVDECQDQVEAMPDIVARTRGGANPPIFATATAKDSPEWRTYRDSLSKYWTIYRISYLDAWAIHDSYWTMFKEECSEREWKRRGLALDVGPERMVYHSWERSANLIDRVPVGLHDVTGRVLRGSGRNFAALVGHDPGALQDATVVLKAYAKFNSMEHIWVVVDEIHTKETTTAEHAIALRNRLQSKWGINFPIRDGDEPQALLRIDPYGENDAKTDRSVYNTFKAHGFDARSAAFRKGKGNGRIPKDPGIEMVNSLLCHAHGHRRLFVLQDERGRPVAPRLVEALELSERDGDGKAETQKKNRKGPGGDLSDFPAALRYALWQVERVRGQTQLRAMDPIA
jgi:hypothetical protein